MATSVSRDSIGTWRLYLYEVIERVQQFTGFDINIRFLGHFIQYFYTRPQTLRFKFYLRYMGRCRNPAGIDYRYDLLQGTGQFIENNFDSDYRSRCFDAQSQRESIKRA